MSVIVRLQNETLNIQPFVEDLSFLRSSGPAKNLFVATVGALLTLSLLAKWSVLKTLVTGPSIPINPLLLTDQLMTLLYNLANSSTLIWTAATQQPLAEVFGSKFCWLLHQINMFGFVYSIAGGSAIAAYRVVVVMCTLDLPVCYPHMKLSHRWIMAIVANTVNLILSAAIVAGANILSHSTTTLELCQGYNCLYLQVLRDYNRALVVNGGEPGLIIASTLATMILIEVVCNIQLFRLIAQQDR